MANACTLPLHHTEGEIDLRYIFFDETGVSDNQPFTLVAGVIVGPDQQLKSVEEQLARLSEQVPRPFWKEHPYIHAHHIINSKFMRDEWPVNKRAQLLCDVMRIPRENHLGLAVGARKRSVQSSPQPGFKMSNVERDHAYAFVSCISQADRMIRTYGYPDEVATAIHENTGSRNYLRTFARGLVRFPMQLPDGSFFVRNTPERPASEAGVRKIAKVRMPIYFAEKQDEPLLQLADVCAFGLKRFYGNHRYSEMYAEAIFGETIPESPDFEKVWDVAGAYIWVEGQPTAFG